MNNVRNKIIAIAIITILLVTLVAICAMKKMEKTENITSVGATTNKMALEEEVVPVVKEEVISVTADQTIDESLIKEDEEETVVVEDKKDKEVKKVKVPKSTVAPVNSSEDAEKNKKNGGEAVSQSQATQMFENVGTKSFGIDVSAHQGKINWAEVKKDNVDFAIIRCGFRGQSQGGIYEDAYFKTNVAGAIANGIKVGIYFYSTAVNENEALEEAAWVISKIKTYKITYPVVYDFEDFGAYRCSNVDGGQATRNAITFLNLVSSAGYEPMMYANKNDITNRMSRSSFGCKFWLAHYTTTTDYKGSYNMWQYTSRGSVKGINGNVDMDIAYFSYGATAEPKHVHEYTEVVKGSEKASTCAEVGTRTLRCSCGESITQELPKTEHTFGEWVIEKASTENEQGLKRKTCTVCGYSETEVIEKLKPSSKDPSTQTEENKDTNTNTDTNTSNNPGENNNTTNDTGKEEKPHEHKFVESKTDPTCTSKGSINKKCSECKEEVIEEIPALGHNFVEGKCSRCGEVDPTFVPKEESKPDETNTTQTPNENIDNSTNN